jgi:hypothetical protein
MSTTLRLRPARLAIGLGNPAAEAALLPLLSAVDDLEVAARCLGAEELLVAAREPAIDAVLVSLDLHRLTSELLRSASPSRGHNRPRAAGRGCGRGSAADRPGTAAPIDELRLHDVVAPLILCAARPHAMEQQATDRRLAAGRVRATHGGALPRMRVRELGRGQALRGLDEIAAVCIRHVSSLRPHPPIGRGVGSARGSA